MRWKHRRRQAQELLARVGAAIDPGTSVQNLSMPEQQLVEIARALGANARILILDEPTASLTDREVDRLLQLLRDLRKQGVGIIYISHRLEELFQVADRVTVLRDGSSIATRPMAEIDRAEMIRLMVGREVTAIFPKQTVALGDPVLELAGIGCRASGVHDVSFEVRDGEIVGLAGLVGAGRTELARCLFGLTPADEGSLRWHGEKTHIDSPARAVELGIAYVPEDRRRHGVILELPVAANATLAVLNRLSRFGLMNFRRERTLAAEYVAAAVDQNGVARHAGRRSIGRQSTKSRHRALAGHTTNAVDPRRADAGHRRRREGRNPPPDGQPGRRRNGDFDDLLRIAGNPGNERPHCGDARSHGGRNAGSRRGHAGKSFVVGVGACCADGGGCVIMRYRREISVAVALLVVLGVLAVAAPSFFRGNQLPSIAVENAGVLVAAVGMAIVILAREIDISIGSMLSICGVAAGLLAKSGVPMPLVAAATMAIGGLLGVVNGVFVAGLGLPSIVVTLATMKIFAESLRWWREGEFVSNLPPDFQWFGCGQQVGQWIVVGVALAVFLLFAWALRFLKAGRAVYATGSDPAAAWLVGVRPRRVTFWVFVLMGALTGLAAVLDAVRLPQVDPGAGGGLELQVIAAVVVGGVAISGGRGTLIGVLFGVALLATIHPALVFMGAKPYWSKALEGAIILIAVASDAFSFRRRGHVVAVAP